MRKLKKGRILSREKDQRKALLRNLAGQLVMEEKIKTTEAKAKEVASFIEKQITKSKKDEINSRRLLAKILPEKVVKKMVDDLGKRYAERRGGYTRITKIGPRKSDSAKIVFIELI